LDSIRCIRRFGFEDLLGLDDLELDSAKEFVVGGKRTVSTRSFRCNRCWVVGWSIWEIG